MNVFDKIENFEEQGIMTIAYNMVKWFCFDEVNVDFQPRDNVESGMWITVKIQINSKTYYIVGQRIDVVHRKLVQWIRLHIEKARGL